MKLSVFSDNLCPKCGAQLLIMGKHEYCAVPGCDYGDYDEDVNKIAGTVIIAIAVLLIFACLSLLSWQNKKRDALEAQTHNEYAKRGYMTCIVDAVNECELTNRQKEILQDSLAERFGGKEALYAGR